MTQESKQFSTQKIFFICCLIVGGIILILFDNLINPFAGYMYISILGVIFIFLGVMLIIRSLILLLRARQQENNQFYIKKIVFICSLIVGIIFILVDIFLIRSYSASGYLTVLGLFIIFLGVMLIIRGLRRARLQEN
jgi:drug/metabolite transporter (DMT)-like permease